MENKLSILIYEKEKHLNSILYQQILDTIDYDPYSVHDQIKLIELVNKKYLELHAALKYEIETSGITKKELQ